MRKEKDLTEIKNTSELVSILNAEVRMNLDSEAELARKADYTRQHLNKTLGRLKEENNRVPFNSIIKILNGAGYQIFIRRNKN